MFLTGAIQFLTSIVPLKVEAKGGQTKPLLKYHVTKTGADPLGKISLVDNPRT
jgi:hypothetical protein